LAHDSAGPKMDIVVDWQSKKTGFRASAAEGYAAKMHEIIAIRVARKLRAGVVNVNGNAGDYDVPFGGYKESGNGREAGPLGFHEYLETKAITI
ncbi:MAG: aldehyde dehydrogenase family protein, partial [Pseudomonadota bacterium]